MLTATTIGSRLTPQVGARPLVPVGSLIAAGGMALLTRLELDSSCLAGVLPGLILIGLGLGLVFAPTQNTATSGVGQRDAGVASAMINTMQQIGGSIGTALLGSFAAGGAANYVAGGVPGPRTAALAALDSYHTVFWWSGGFFRPLRARLRPAVPRRPARREPGRRSRPRPLTRPCRTAVLLPGPNDSAAARPSGYCGLLTPDNCAAARLPDFCGLLTPDNCAAARLPDSDAG